MILSYLQERLEKIRAKKVAKLKNNEKLNADACEHKAMLYEGSNICADCGSVIEKCSV